MLPTLLVLTMVCGAPPAAPQPPPPPADTAPGVPPKPRIVPAPTPAPAPVVLPGPADAPAKPPVPPAPVHPTPAPPPVALPEPKPAPVPVPDAPRPPAPPAAPVAPPAEMRVLERLIGTWDDRTVTKPAVWTPKEAVHNYAVTKSWTLGGKFIETRTKPVDGGLEGYSLTTFDAARREYRNWYFDAAGTASETRGNWDAATQSLQIAADPQDGLTAKGRIRFVDDDTVEWEFAVRDAAGKAYLHLVGTSKRKK